MDVPLLYLGLALSALFVVAYTLGRAALERLSPAVLHGLRSAGDELNSKRIDRIERERDKRLLRARVGHTVSVTLAAALTAVLARDLPAYETFLWVLGSAGLAVILTLVTRGIVLSFSSAAILRLLRYSALSRVLMTPLTEPFVWVGSVLDSLFPEREDTPEMSTLAVEHLIEEGEKTGSIPEEHAELLYGVLEMRNTVAREVMVPRGKMTSFSSKLPLSEIIDTLIDSGHSRYPVHGDSVDHVDAILYIKDVFRLVLAGALAEKKVGDVARKEVFVTPETKKIEALLREMQQRRLHLAVVVDEFGGTAGLVTLEDIVEEIVGEIEDEHDSDKKAIFEKSEGIFIVRADTSVYDFEAAFGEALVEEKGDYDSIGGLVVTLAGGVPAAGQTLTVGSHAIRVIAADARRVEEVEIRRDAADETSD